MIRRRRELSRSSTLTPSGKPRARNAKRQAKEFVRCFHSDERQQFVAALPCVECGRGPCDNAHTKNDGASRRGPFTAIVPLCRPCHRLQHDKGWSALRFLCTEDEREHHARRTEFQWQTFCAARRPVSEN